MVPESVKEFIIKQMLNDLYYVDIIHHEDSVWFIDREKEYWYFELKMDGMLWWRYSHFKQFFSLFSLSPDEYRPIIVEFVERVLNVDVKGQHLFNHHNKKRVSHMLGDIASITGEKLITEIVNDMDFEYQHPKKVKDVIQDNVSLQIKEVILGENQTRINEVLNDGKIKATEFKSEFAGYYNDEVNINKVYDVINNLNYGR